MEMTRGDDRKIVMEAVYPEDVVEAGVAAGDPYPLDGATVWFTAESPQSTIAKKSGAGIETSGNLATILIDATDTESLAGPTTYQWDFQIRTAGGKIHTLAKGSLVVRPDITRETV